MASETTSTLTPSHRSGVRESMLGRMLIFGIVGFFVLLVGLMTYAVYRTWHRGYDTRLSISTLKDSVSLTGQVSDTPSHETASAQTQPLPMASESTGKSNTATVLRVLNSGAPAGSAGAMMKQLKNLGYKNVTAGDATGSYTKTTVYYRSDAEKATAQALLTEIKKAYPTAMALPADATNKETVSEAIVMVLSR